MQLHSDGVITIFVPGGTGRDDSHVRGACTFCVVSCRLMLHSSCGAMRCHAPFAMRCCQTVGSMPYAELGEEFGGGLNIPTWTLMSVATL
jgi:hypothetical protein